MSDDKTTKLVAPEAKLRGGSYTPKPYTPTDQRGYTFKPPGNVTPSPPQGGTGTVTPSPPATPQGNGAGGGSSQSKA